MFAAASPASPLAAIIYILWLVAGAYVYISLVRQIVARNDVVSPVEGSTSSLPPIAPGFGVPESILAAVLITLLVLGITSSFSAKGTSQVSVRALLSSLILTGIVILIIVALLKFRRRNIVDLAGLTKLGVTRAIFTGALLLFFAYPLLNTTELILQRLYRGAIGNQSIVDFFNDSQTLRERIVVIIFAVVIAPLSEEFLFRFFIYGVLRRHFGVTFGLLANALLFAAAHGHLPSLPLLFILGVCFTIAYEWSGSLFVNMTMHALFNAVALTALAFPGLSSQ